MIPFMLRWSFRPPTGGAINLALFVIEIAGFALSLWSGGFVRRRTA